MAVELVKELLSQYPGVLAARYDLLESADPTVVFSYIAKNRNCLKKGGELDHAKAAALLLEEFRSGRLGRITIETPSLETIG